MKRYFPLLILNFTFLIFNFQFASAIEVSGHLTEDTVWSPDNNPYHVVDNIFVDADVNLTILPGTEIYIQSTPLTNIDDFMDDFCVNAEYNLGKMFWVDGSITAIGTETDSIRFTRLNDEPDNYWGNIYITSDADKCTFKFCNFEYSGGQVIYITLLTYATVTFYNKEIEVENCHFRNYMGGVDGPAYLWMEKVSIIDNVFEIDEGINDFVENRNYTHMLMNTQIESFPDPLIAGNIFNGNYLLDVNNGYIIYNEFKDNNRVCFLAGGRGRTSYFFKNDFINQSYGILVNGDNITDSVFFKQNRFKL